MPTLMVKRHNQTVDEQSHVAPVVAVEDPLGLHAEQDLKVGPVRRQSLLLVRSLKKVEDFFLHRVALEEQAHEERNLEKLQFLP
jgi:hypothetical protein